MDNLWGGWDVRNKKHRHPNEDDFSFQQKFPKMCGLETAPPWGFEISLQRYYIFFPFVGQVRPIITGRVFFLQASPPASPPSSPLEVV